MSGNFLGQSITFSLIMNSKCKPIMNCVLFSWLVLLVLTILNICLRILVSSFDFSNTCLTCYGVRKADRSGCI